MSLLWRTARILGAAVGGSKLELLDTSRVAMRVWPGDLDFNGHMNNGRYLTLMDLGRFDLIARSPGLGAVVKNRWRPIVGAATIRFRRSLKPFALFTLETRMVCWDPKWMFLEQRFVHEGHIAAVGFVKGLFRAQSGNVPSAEVARAMGHHGDSPPMLEELQVWAQSAATRLT